MRRCIITTVVNGKLIELGHVDDHFEVLVGTYTVAEFWHVVSEPDKTLALQDAIGYYSKLIKRYGKTS